MDLSTLLHGLILGFSIAAPVGPIGVLCIRRAIVDGRRYAFFSGLGAATADAIYGWIAGFGLTFISGLLLSHQRWLRLLGGAYLCYLGYKTVVSTPTDRPTTGTASNLLTAYTSTLVLTLTNPATILSFVAIFAGMGLASTARDYSAASIFVVGVFLGSALWWLLLSSGVAYFRSRLKLHYLRWINMISGAIIVGFGVLAILSMVQR